MHRRQKRFFRALRRPFEWIGIGIGYAAFAFLPRRAMLAVCDFAAGVMHFFDRRGRALALSNLRVVYGRDIPGAEKIVRRSYSSMARSVGYAFWTCRNAKARAAAAGEMSEEGKSFLAANRPAVTVSAHLGCWEILSQLAFLEGHRMMSVAKDIGTSGMTRLLMKARESIGQEIVHADGAFRSLMQGLKNGKSLGLLVDQVVKPREGGIWVRFFGRPMPVSAAPAFFAAKGKAPVIIAWSRPLKDGRWRCEIISSYSSEDARDIWGFTQKCIHDLECVIRRHPSCWVLNYRYFRKTPNAEELAQLEAREAKAKEES
jgi:Lauroyl/myristoyl acyltransferase